MFSSWLETNHSHNYSTALRFARASLQSWQLSSRTLNALLHHNHKMTIGDVIQSPEDIKHIRGLGVTGLTELNTKIVNLLNENKESNSTPILLTPLPTSLPEDIGKLSLNQLHLDTTTHSALLKEKLLTIADLYNVQSSQLGNISGLHPDSLGTINDALVTLLCSISDEGNVNWFYYYGARQIDVLPTTSTYSTSLESLVNNLPSILEEVFRREHDERSWTIIQRRYGLGQAKLTLEDIGNALSLTRERVRQLEAKAIKKLQNVFLLEHYSGKNYHIHPKLHTMVQTICSMIADTKYKLILETKILEYAYLNFGLNSKKIKASLFFLLSLDEVEQVDFNYLNAIPVWGYIDATQRKGIENALKRLDKFLTEETSFPHIEFDILVHINKGLKKSEQVKLDQLPALINLCSTIETREDGSTWGKFAYLKGRMNQVERILAESGRIMSISDITREINYRLVPLGQHQATENNLLNQMCNDERFVSVGRSGKWGLKSWDHIDTKNILEHMEHFFITQNKPATVDEIYTYVSERRSVSRNSITIYLVNEPNLFARMDRTTWGLAKWTNNVETRTWNKEEVADFVANFFKKQRVKEIDYKLLKQALMDEANISSSQAQGLLNQSPALKTRKGTHDKERQALFQQNYKESLSQVKTQKHQRERFRKQLEVSVHSILEASPGKRMQMADLVRQLQKLHNCPESTVYSHILRMNFVERFGENSHSKICILIEDEEKTADRGDLRHRISEYVRSVLVTAPNKELTLAELVELVQKKCACPRATAYQYVSKLDFVESIVVPHKNGKLCRLKEILPLHKPHLFSQVEEINDIPLRKKVERALPLLNEEFVDLGLFLLSKEFEATLKSYLVASYNKGYLKNTPGGKSPDKLSLSEMVSCIKSNGIVTDDAALSYLRQSRNDRAHGTMPTQDERKVLMNNVQHLAEMYIDYIKWFDDLRQKL